MGVLDLSRLAPRARDLHGAARCSSQSRWSSSAGSAVVYRKVRTRVAMLNAFIQENVVGMTVVQLFRQEDRGSSRSIRELNRQHTDAHYRVDPALLDLLPRRGGARARSPSRSSSGTAAVRSCSGRSRLAGSSRSSSTRRSSSVRSAIFPRSSTFSRARWRRRSASSGLLDTEAAIRSPRGPDRLR